MESKCDELLEKFLQYHQNRGHSARTLETYREILQDFLKESDPSKVGIRELDNYIGIYSYLSINTRNLKTSCLRSFFKWLNLYEYRKDNPSEKLFTIKREGVGEVKYILDEDFKKIITKTKSRDRLMFSLGYKCGLRLSEILGLTKDCLLKDIRALKIHGKGSKIRIIPVPDILWRELSEYYTNLESLGTNGKAHLFITRNGKPMNKTAFYSIWRTRMKRLGFSYSPHALRHGCATRWLRKGANIREVQELLGHSSISTTQLYTHIVTSQLRELVNRGE